MPKKLLAIIIGVLLMAGLNAVDVGATKSGREKTDQHDDNPTNKSTITGPKASCTVTGSVSLEQGLSGGIPSHDHYTLTGTIACNPVSPTNEQHQNLGGKYDVFAFGGTDGPGMKDAKPKVDAHTAQHGERCALGWSANDGYTNSLQPKDKPTGGAPSGGNLIQPKSDPQNKGFIRVFRFAPPDGKFARGWVKFTRQAMEIGLRVRSELRRP